MEEGEEQKEGSDAEAEGTDAEAVEVAAISAPPTSPRPPGRPWDRGTSRVDRRRADAEALKSHSKITNQP